MKENLKSLIDKSNGYLLTSVASDYGYSRQNILYYAKVNNLIKVAQGIYITDNTWPDHLYILQLKNKDIIYSFETALYLHNLMEREPAYTEVTVKHGYNAMHLKNKGLKIRTSIPQFYNMGIEYVKTPFGNDVKTYDMERTICDIIKNKKYMDIQVFTYALKEYAKYKNKRIPVLMEYAEKLKVKDKVRLYFEVLL